MYKKDFDGWNVEKKNLELQSQNQLLFHSREIWWCSLGVNLGDEQDGKNERFERPVLVIRKFNRKLAWIVPLSTKIKAGPYYHTITHDGQMFSVILSQLRIVSTKRFLRLIRKLSRGQFSEIQSKIHSLLH